MPYDHISSLPAYKEKGKDQCRQQVFNAIRKLQPCTDKKLAEHLQWPINRITGRRNELVEKEIVTLAKKDTDPESNRLVSWWQVKQIYHQPILF